MTTADKIAQLVEAPPPAPPELCIASKSRATVVDLLREDGKTCIYGSTLEEVRAREGYEDAEIMPLQDWCEWRAAQQDTPLTWEPSTLKRYEEALGCVPPIDWRRDGFLLGEPYDHHALTGRPRFQAHRHYAGAYYVSSRPITRHEWRDVAAEATP